MHPVRQHTVYKYRASFSGTYLLTCGVYAVPRLARVFPDHPAVYILSRRELSFCSERGVGGRGCGGGEEGADRGRKKDRENYFRKNTRPPPASATPASLCSNLENIYTASREMQQAVSCVVLVGHGGLLRLRTFAFGPCKAVSALCVSLSLLSLLRLQHLAPEQDLGQPVRHHRLGLVRARVREDEQPAAARRHRREHRGLHEPLEQHRLSAS